MNHINQKILVLEKITKEKAKIELFLNELINQKIKEQVYAIFESSSLDECKHALDLLSKRKTTKK